MKNRIFLAGLLLMVLLASRGAVATTWSAQDYDLYSGDFNGDGVPDLLYIAKAPGNLSGIALGVGDGFDSAFQSWSSNFLGIPWSGNQYNVIVLQNSGGTNRQASILLQSKASGGDSYELQPNTQGRIVAKRTLGSSGGMVWSADQHNIVTGDFNHDGLADVFLQATSPSGTNAIMLADSHGQFTASAPGQTWGDGFLGFKWATSEATVYAGDFNGDGYSDLLIQARPNWAIIDYDPPFPVPTYPPNMNGIAFAHSAGTLFSATAAPGEVLGYYAWSRYAFGVDWSPLVTNIFVGQFSASPYSDILLQALHSEHASYLVTANGTGSVFAAGTALASNVSWSADKVHLIAGKFGGASTGIYFQALVPSGANSFATRITGGSVSTTSQDPAVPPPGTKPIAAGRTGGAFTVTNSGAASYTIPLWTPPGIGDLQLRLLLSYNSGGLDDVLGIGWSLGGSSAISRCGRTWEQDGAPQAITLTTSDRLCLDGKELKVVAGSASAPAQGGSTFATELESFSQVVANGSSGSAPSSFTVTTKGGLIFDYGLTPDSQIMAGSSGVVRLWALSQMRDRVGNIIKFKYYNDATAGAYTNGTYRIREIDYPYTANGQGPFYQVLFNYAPRPVTDIPSGAIAGYPVQEPNELTSVQIQEYGGSAIKTYTLTYGQGAATSRLRLASVTECSPSSCFPATTIGYQDGQAGWVTQATAVGQTTADPSLTFSVDMNGDGMTDLLYPVNSGSGYQWYVMFASGGGLFSTPQPTGVATTTADTVIPADFAGRGVTDLLYPSGGYWWRLYWNGSAFITASTGLPISTIYGSSVGAMAADVNGDGLPDLAWTSSGNTGTDTERQIFIAFNTTTPGSAVSFAVPSGPAYSLPRDTGPCSDNPQGVTWGFVPTNNSYSNNQTIQAADFNADGRQDIWARVFQQQCRGSGSIVYYWRQLISNGTGFDSGISFDALSGSLLEVLIDWDGDGCTDVVDPSPLTTGTWQVRLTCANQQSPALIDTGIPNGQLIIAADWDGDGRQDILTPQNGTWHVARSTGTGVAPLVDTGITVGSGAWFVGDFDGDGLVDLGWADLASSNALHVNQHNGSFVYPDLAVAFTDGFGIQQVPTYSPIDHNNYTKCSGATADCPVATFPEKDYQGPLYVVNQLSASDGLGTTYQDQFWYYGARVHAQGRGFEGFYARRSNDSRDVDAQGNRLFRYEYFGQRFPYTGLAEQRLVSTNSNVSLGAPSGDISLWSATPASQMQTAAGQGASETRYFPFQQHSNTKQYEFGALGNGVITTIAKTFTYGDGYGNATNVQTTVTDNDPNSPFSGQVWQTTIASTFLNDNTASSWCLGLPTQTTVTSSAQGQAPLTRTYAFTPDPSHQLCREQQAIVEPNTAALNVSETLSYDSCGNLSQVDVAGHNFDGSAMGPPRTTKYNYAYSTARCQFPEAVTDALGEMSTISYQYDLGLPMQATDPNGISVNWVYDDFGRRVQETRADKTSTNWSFKFCVNAPCWGFADLRFVAIQNEYDANGVNYFTRDQFYDGLQRLRFDESNRVLGTWTVNEERTYDQLGRVVAENVPFSLSSNGQWTYSYDLLSRPIARQLFQSGGALDRKYSLSYAGRTVQVTDPLSNVRSYVKDVAGQLRVVTDPLPGSATTPGATTKYDYDDFGNLVRITDGIGVVWSASYNLRGLRYQVADPDAGNWTFQGDSLNEVTAWTNGNKQSFLAQYDALGRMIQRSEPEGTSTWTWGGSAGAYNIGSLQAVSGYGYTENLAYDSAGRLKTRNIATDQTYQYDYAYNSIGAIDTITYPQSPAPTGTTANRFEIQYGYSYGVPARISDVTQGAPVTLWSLSGANDYSSPTNESLGSNAVSVESTFTPWTDDLTSIQSGVLGSASNRQNLAYQWDTNGNLHQRTDVTQGLTEVFSYDALNRLTSSRLNGQPNFSASYTDSSGSDRSGNIVSRSDVGSYTYGDSTHPHGVTAAGAYSFAYDANGNVTSRNGLSLKWASYNLPISLQAAVGNGTYSSQFSYGPDHQRYSQSATYSNGIESTYYVGGLLEKVAGSDMGGVTSYRHYVPTPSGLTIIVGRNSDSSTTTTYALSDHLGSSDALVDGTPGHVGNLLASESFAAFGQRRASNWTAGGPSSAEWQAIAKATRRGFTFHEELDNIGLIHMNGRVYDPNVGRFLSGDPVIGDLGDSQSVNPYAYVGNRPLSFTDPTGFMETVPVYGNSDGGGGENLTAGAVSFFKWAGKSIGQFFRFGGGHSPPAAQSVAQSGNSAQSGIGSSLRSAALSGGIGDPISPDSVLINSPWLPNFAVGQVYPGFGVFPGWWSLISNIELTPNDPKSVETVTVTAGHDEPTLGQPDRDLYYTLAGGGAKAGISALKGLGGIAARRAAREGAARGGLAAVRAGQAGEAAVRAAYNIGPKTAINIAGRTRIPDGLLRDALSEVKNVNSLSYTQQLRDFTQYATQNGLRFDLYVRPGAQLSGPLLDAIDSGLINRLEIPFP